MAKLRREASDRESSVKSPEMCRGAWRLSLDTCLRLGVHPDHGAQGSPVEEEGRHVERQIHAAMAHPRSEVAVPVGAMQGFRIVVEVHDMGYVLDVVWCTSLPLTFAQRDDLAA